MPVRLAPLIALLVLFAPAAHVAPAAADPAVAAPAAAPDGDPRRAVLAAMRDELNRSMQQLRLKDYEAPYYIAYAVRENEREEVVGRLGALYESGHRRDRHVWAQVRVGGWYRSGPSMSSAVTPSLEVLSRS